MYEIGRGREREKVREIGRSDRVREKGQIERERVCENERD